MQYDKKRKWKVLTGKDEIKLLVDDMIAHVENSEESTLNYCN